MKNGVKEDVQILLQANTGSLFNKTNPYIIKVLIVKAIPVIKTLKIPNIQLIQTNWTIKPITKRVKDILFVIKNREIFYQIIQNSKIKLPKICFNYRIVGMLNILYFLADPVLIFVNKAIIRDKAKIQVNQVSIKIYCKAITGFISIYILSFVKKVYLFTLFGFVK